MQFTRNHQIGTKTTLTLFIAALAATLLILSTATSAPAAAQTPSNPPVDRAALVALYNATDGENWRDNTNWLNDDVPLNEWYGVDTDVSGRVTAMIFHGNNLTGTIPGELGNLSSLSSLHLDDNNLTGTIPGELGSLSNLSELDLADNALTGAIPRELGNLSSLTWLDLGDNELTGAIPRELGNLSNLVRLYLWDNALTGAIPGELGNLSNLTRLALSNNELTGTIPQSFTSLTELAVFTFSGNAGLCVPADEDLQAWLNSISNRFHSDTGPSCSDREHTANALLDRYDADESGQIDLSEVNMAIDDYFNEQLTLAEVNIVIDLYFS